MVEEIMKHVPKDYAVLWLIMALAVVVGLVIFIPKIWRGFNKMRGYVNDLEAILESAKKNSKDIDNLSRKIEQDYKRLNYLEEATRDQQDYIDDSLHERELILKSLLGVIRGLQEIGANGPTKKAEQEIEEYLIEKAHKVKDEEV